MMSCEHAMIYIDLKTEEEVVSGPMATHPHSLFEFYFLNDKQIIFKTYKY